MNYNRLLLRMGHILIWFFALSSVLDLIIINRWQFGPDPESPYSIFSSRSVFIAYQIWTIILCGVTSYSLWKKHRMLFLISTLLLLIVIFYPTFTQGKKPYKTKTTQTEQPAVDSTEAPIPDSLK